MKNNQLFKRTWLVLWASILSLVAVAQTVTVQTEQAGTLWDALEAQGVTDFSMVKSLKVTGVIGDADFQLIKNLMNNLEEIDLAGTNFTDLPERVFAGKEALKICRLPEQMTSIGNWAFENCPNLKSLAFGSQTVEEGKIVFPEKMRTLGYSAFNGCRSLTRLDFSACKAFEWMDYYCFYNCFGLQAILFPTTGNMRIAGCSFALDTWQSDEFGYGNGPEELTLTKAVTTLEDNCLPNRLKKLYVESTTPANCSESSFDNLDKDNLTVYVPVGTKKLYAVANGWTKIYANMQEMGFMVNISGHGSLQLGERKYVDGSVCFPTAGTATTLKAVPDLGCELISVKFDGNAVNVAADGTFTIPAGTTTGTLDVAFTINQTVIDNPNGGELYDKILALDINPKTVRALKVTGTVNARDWQSMRTIMIGLETIDLTETNITAVPSEALRGHAMIKEVLLPQTTKRLEGNAFTDCSKLSLLPITDNIEYIGDDCFDGCTALTVDKLVLPASLSQIGSSPFDWIKTTSVDMSQCHLTSNLNYYVFSSQVENILLPQKERYGIEYLALDHCNIKELTIPACVNYIGYNSLPRNLTTLYVQGTSVIPASGDAFGNINRELCTVYVPTGLSIDYQFAEGWSGFTNLKEYGFTVKTNDHGAVTMDGKSHRNGSICFPTVGQATTLKVVPDAGYDIGTVTLNGEAVALQANGTFTIPATTISGAIEVTFVNAKYDVTLQIEGKGTVSINGQAYASGTTLNQEGGSSLKLTLAPAQGSFVKQVTIGGEEAVLKNGGLEHTIPALSASTAIKVTFSADASTVATVTFRQEGFGTVSYRDVSFEDGSTLTLIKGTSAQLSITPNGDSRLTALTVGGTDVTASVSNNAYTLSNISANTTVASTFFSPNQLSIDNPDGGELYDKILALGSNPKTLRTLKVTGKLSTKDWSMITNLTPLLEELDLSGTDIKQVPNDALRDRDRLTIVKLPTTVTVIKCAAFHYCPNLTEVTGCENIEELEDDAFSDCYKLANFPFGDKVKRICSSALRSCGSLPETLVLPATVYSVGWNDTFNGSSIRKFDLSQCRLTESFCCNTFGEATTVILTERGNYGLSGEALRWTQLTELTLPACITHIDNDVMPGTLKRLYVRNPKPINVDVNAFRPVDITNAVLYVPTGSSMDYNVTPGWMSFLNIKEYGLLVKTGSHGSVNYGGQNYQDGSICWLAEAGAQTLQVVPNAGYEIATVTFNGAAVTLSDDGSFTLPEGTISGKLEATFTNKQLEVAVSLTGNGSYVIDGQTYTANTNFPAKGGSIVKMQLVPADGSFVKNIALNGESQVLKNGGLELTTQELDNNTTIAITFSDDATSIATVTFQQEGFGTVNCGGQTFEDGSTLTLEKGGNAALTLTPYGDSKLQLLTVDGADVTANMNDNVYTLSNITANTTVKATFFSPNMIVVDNPNGGELKDLIIAMGSTPNTIKTLKVTGKMAVKDWNYVKSSLTQLEEFDISETNTKNVPEEVFRDRVKLAAMHLPSTVTSIGSYAFWNCQQLAVVDGCESVQEISNGAFGYCGQLANFPFGNDIRKIESEAFRVCSALPDKLEMPASLQVLGWNDVFNGSSVRSFDLSQCTLTCTFAWNTFGECTSLVLPEYGDYQMSDHALEGTKLTELRLPGALSSIWNDHVFPATLERLYVCRTEPIGLNDPNNVFANVDRDLCELYVPRDAKEAYSNAEGWSDFVKVQEYGMTVSVGEQGKLRCDNRTIQGTTSFFPIATTASFEILPNAGWHAASVTLNGTDVPFTNNKFTLDNDQLNGKLSVEFAANQFVLQLQIIGDGLAKWGSMAYTTSQTLTVDSLSILNFTLEPAAGKVVTNITFNGKESVVQNGGTTYVTPAITANATLAITFADSNDLGDVVAYNVTTSGNGTVEYKNTLLLPQTSIMVKKGQDAVFILKPDLYCQVDEVKLNGQDVTDQVDASNCFTVKNVDAAAQLEISFRVNSEITVVTEQGGQLRNMLTDEQKKKVTKLTIVGPMWDDDFYAMRDDMPMLAVVDLWQADCDYVPYGAFCTNGDWGNPTGKRTLTSIRLPERTRSISGFAFAGCANLNQVNFTELKNLEAMYEVVFNGTDLHHVDLSQTRLVNEMGSTFYRAKKLESVKLPATLTRLTDAFAETELTEVDLSGCTSLKTLESTFRDCHQLTKVTLPEGITTLNGTFNNCNELTTVNLPKSIESIGGGTFYNTKLQKVDLSQLTKLNNIGENAFRYCQQLEEVLLPASVEQIGNWAFESCYKLKAIDMSKLQLQTLGESAFNSCSTLESVKLPATLTSIGPWAFANCEKLGGMLELPATMVSIGGWAFENTQLSVFKSNATTPPSLGENAMGNSWVAAFVPEGYASVYKAAPIWEDKIILDKEVHADITVSSEGNLAIDINNQAGVAPGIVTHLTVHGPLNATDFAVMRSNMTVLYDLDMEDTEVSIIPDNAFLDKKILMDLKLPRNLLTIQQNAFRGCTSLRGTLKLPASLKTIGWAAFEGCSSLSKVELNDALEVIRSYAFNGCTNLTQELKFPANFMSLGEYAFANCRNLYGTVGFNSEFYMFIGSEGYWSSTGRAFQYCSGIEGADLSACEYLTMLPEGTFEGCTSLKTVLLPPYLERIEHYTFQSCTSLDNIVFPQTMKELGHRSFAGCTSLRSVNLSDSPDFGTIESWAFESCNDLVSVNLPKGLNWIQEYAFYNCRKLANINVEAIHPADLGEYVFKGVHTDRCVLSIPTGTFNDYLTAAQWGEFVQMRNAIDVKLDEGATLTFSNNDNADEADETAGARGMRRALGSAAEQSNAKVKDGSSLYVNNDESVTFYITPDENVSIRQILFNGEDVTGQLVDGAYETPRVTDASSFEVLLNVDGPITVKELRMNDTELAIKVAESHQMKATVLPNNASNKTIIWTTSDEEIVKVSADGIITGVAPGRATVTACTEDGGFKKECVVTIMSNDYYIALNDFDTFVDNTVWVPLSLHNADAAKGLQFDVYMPDGVGMDNDWSGDFGIQLSGRSNGHQVEAARRYDGSVRVIVYSQEGNDFNENDGELLWLPISIRDMAGSFDVTLKNVHVSGPRSFDFTAPDYTVHIKVKDYPLGDSNGDGEVTITDVANTIEEILERHPERFIKKPADVNKDDIITVADLTATVDIMLGRYVAGSRSSNRMQASAATFDRLYADDFNIGAGERKTIELKLTNMALYTALQCDLFLPEGLHIALDEDGEPMVETAFGQDGHLVTASFVGNGAIRIISMSMANEKFSTSGESVLRITVEADETLGQESGTLCLNNVRLVDFESRAEFNAPESTANVSFAGVVTSIAGLDIDGMKVRTEGRQLFVSSPKATTVQLVSPDGKARTLKLQRGENRFYVNNAGVYILNRQKITIK